MAKAKTQERELECLCMIVEAHTQYSTSQNIKTRPREYVFILHRAFSVNKGKYKNKINRNNYCQCQAKLHCQVHFGLCSTRKYWHERLAFQSVGVWVVN